MFLHIDPADELAIYDQIVRQLKFAIAAGVLRPGELVPSVRETARQLAVNPNTVARAFRELQTEQVLHTVRGTGLAVTEDAPERCRRDRKELIRHRVRGALREACRSRLSVDEIRNMVHSELQRVENGEPD